MRVTFNTQLEARQDYNYADDTCLLIQNSNLDDLHNAVDAVMYKMTNINFGQLDKISKAENRAFFNLNDSQKILG